MNEAGIDPVKSARRRALQRAGLAAAAALVLLIGALVFEDGREAESPAQETAPTSAPELAAERGGAAVQPLPAESAAPAGVSEVTIAAVPVAAAGAEVSVADAGTGGAVDPAAAPPNAPEPAPKPVPPLADGYLVQLGVFGALENAEALRADVAARGLPARVEGRVVVGPFRDKAEADGALARLRREGMPVGFVVPPRAGSGAARAGK